MGRREGNPHEAHGGGGRKPNLYVSARCVSACVRACASPLAGPHLGLCVGPAFEEEVQSGSGLPMGCCLSGAE